MPQVIEHIDKIARDKGRGVLFLRFDRDIFDNDEWETWHQRNELIDWFKRKNITVSECGDIAKDSGYISYRGQLYIDVPFDESSPEYLTVKEHLENTDGSPCFLGIVFCFLPLDLAMKNKHHDEPGYWEEKWKGDF